MQMIYRFFLNKNNTKIAAILTKVSIQKAYSASFPDNLADNI